MIQAIATYPGIFQVIRFSGTWNAGTQPSTFVLEIAPQDLTAVPKFGPLSLSYGGWSVSIPNCTIDYANSQFSQSGETYSLYIRDYRWTWQHAVVTGNYNQRDDAGNIILLTEKKVKDNAIKWGKRSLRELIELVANEMGVKRIRVKDASTTIFPEVSWNCYSAASALEELCRLGDLRICPRLDGSVSVEKNGSGAQLPGGSISSFSETIDPPETPRQIRIVAGPTQTDQAIELEPVGLDLDGTIKPIKELSYAPADWYAESPGHFSGIRDVGGRELAISTVFKWFRIKRATGIEEVLPLFEGRCERFVDKSKLLRKKDAFVYGNFGTLTDAKGPTKTDAKRVQAKDVEARHKDLVVPYRFRVETDSGVVKFDEYVIGFDGAASKFVKPDLWLVCAAGIRNKKTAVFEAYEQTLKLNKNSPAKEDCRVVPEVSLNFYLNGKSNSGEIRGYVAAYAQEVAAEYRTIPAAQATYAGWTAVELDGAIQSISWAMGQQGATTTITRNIDPGSSTARTYRQRQRFADMQARILKADRVQVAAETLKMRGLV